MQERLRQVREKEEDELRLKRERQADAQRQLNEWYAQRNTEIETKRKQNKDEEWAYLRTREEHKKSKNQWEHIIDNVELDPRKHESQTDISRMRQAMLTRKRDQEKFKK